MLASNNDFSWLVGGDFKEILSLSKKKGGNTKGGEENGNDQGDIRVVSII